MVRQEHCTASNFDDLCWPEQGVALLAPKETNPQVMCLDPGMAWGGEVGLPFTHLHLMGQNILNLKVGQKKSFLSSISLLIFQAIIIQKIMQILKDTTTQPLEVKHVSILRKVKITFKTEYKHLCP